MCLVLPRHLHRKGTGVLTGGCHVLPASLMVLLSKTEATPLLGNERERERERERKREKERERERERETYSQDTMRSWPRES